jgi:RNA polymerase sigma factor (sigma-70 family)
VRETLTTDWMASQQDQRIADAVRQEKGRLWNFIRRRVPDAGDAEDILQDVFYELVEAYRMMQPIEQVGAWLFRVARNRITDRFRKKKPELFADQSVAGDEAESFEDMLPSADAGPEAAYARSVMLEELEDALDELPDEQREVFLATEFEGNSFRELAEESGISINTLLSRKRYAVQHLRRRLQKVYEEFGRNREAE